MKEQVDERRVLGPPLRGLFVGAALTLAGGSALAAFSGDPAVWIAPIGVGAGVWNGVVAAVFAGLLVHVVRPLPRWAQWGVGLGLALLTVAQLRTPDQLPSAADPLVSVSNSRRHSGLKRWRWTPSSS